ncbi:hypothetical protein [Thermoflavifilum thermophilum]|uniref:hypothetical protein n=1 Tax=Thermoflavifilum thermophilum TaxID=1393122 RepID=UPI000B8A543E|nr:hypothetical protein [Thermoflavifilum thermophilum]
MEYYAGSGFFSNRQGSLEFTVFDLLNQNANVQRVISKTYIQDTRNSVLHRYFMVKFVYDLREAGQKQKREEKQRYFF